MIIRLQRIMSSSFKGTDLTQKEQDDKVMKDSLEAHIRSLERLREQLQGENSALKQENHDLLRANYKLTEENKNLRKLVSGSEPTQCPSKTPEWYLRLLEDTNSAVVSGGGSASSTVAEVVSTNEWACAACTFDNNATCTKCEMCEAPHP